jgi:hypothetical protein
MTKQEMLEILGIIEELTGKAGNNNSTSNTSNTKNDSEDSSSDVCLKLALVQESRTEDNTTMLVYEGKLCNKVPLLVEIEKHDSEGIRLETLNAIPGRFLKKKFKHIFLQNMYNNFPELH